MSLKLKVVFIGDSAVGKTAVMGRLLGEFFQPTSIETTSGGWYKRLKSRDFGLFNVPDTFSSLHDKNFWDLIQRTDENVFSEGIIYMLKVCSLLAFIFLLIRYNK